MRRLILAAVLALATASCGAERPRDPGEPLQAPSGAASTPARESASPGASPTPAWTGGSYIPVRQWLAAPTRPDDVRTVLFFTRNDCDACRTADKALSTGKLPADLVVVNVPVATHPDLVRRYTVTAAPSYVQVNATGEQLKAWGESTTIAQIDENAE